MPRRTLKKSPTVAAKLMRSDCLNLACEKILDQDFISHLASLAERGAGYRLEKIVWLAWFGQVIRGEKGLLQQLRAKTKHWPPLEREIFEFYYVEHLSLDQIAGLVECTTKAFHAHLLFIQRRLRETLVREVLVELKETSNQRWTGRLRCRKCSSCYRQAISTVMSLV